MPFLSDSERNKLQQLRLQKAELDRLEALEAADVAERAARTQQEVQRKLDHAAEDDAAHQAEAGRVAENRKRLPDVTRAQFEGLPLAMRGKYYESFGSRYLEELVAREKAGGISRDDWEKLQNAEVIPHEVPESQLPPGHRYKTVDGARYLVTPDGNQRLIRSAPKPKEDSHEGMYFGLDDEWHRIGGRRG